jgi:hypothetical protein
MHFINLIKLFKLDQILLLKYEFILVNCLFDAARFDDQYKCTNFKFWD